MGALSTRARPGRRNPHLDAVTIAPHATWLARANLGRASLPFGRRTAPVRPFSGLRASRHAPRSVMKAFGFRRVTDRVRCSSASDRVTCRTWHFRDATATRASGFRSRRSEALCATMRTAHDWWISCAGVQYPTSSLQLARGPDQDPRKRTRWAMPMAAQRAKSLVDGGTIWLQTPRRVPMVYRTCR